MPSESKVGSRTPADVVRYNTDGSLDTAADITPQTAFDADGIVTKQIWGNTYLYAIAIQPDSKKVVVAGVAKSSTNNGDFALARLRLIE